VYDILNLHILSFSLFLLSSLVYILYLIGLFFGWKKAKNQVVSVEKPPFSVIIAARNEAANLERFLPFLLAQVYPCYEICIILDRCTDASKEIMEKWQRLHPQLRYIEIAAIPENWAAKKYVLTQGIAAAKYEHLVLTDADCQVNPEWLQEIAQCFSENIEMVVGLSPYFEEKGILNQVVDYETFYTAFQYIGFAAWGLPYMGVGRNIAYKKSFFLQNKGFSAFQERLSGDDDLFVNAFASGKNTAVMLSPQSATYSIPKMTWRSWIRQKLRHTSAATRYSWQTKLLLTAFGFSYIGHYFWGLCAILTGFSWIPIFFVYLARIFLMRYVFFHKKLRIHPRSKEIFPIIDIFNVLYSTVIVPLGTFITPKWH
jgi:poly-beta-1,6-N-acetyl-D-glucosamine synthase